MRNKFFVLVMVLFLGACATTAPVSTMTPLEIQSMQTREFGQSKNVVFPSVMSVFQDLGYVVKSADKDTGLITAESPAKSNQAMKFWLGVSDVSQTSATAFIETINKKTNVRLNFVTSSKQSYGYGQSDRQDTPVLDAEIYQNAFEKIENAIFVRASR